MSYHNTIQCDTNQNMIQLRVFIANYIFGILVLEIICSLSSIMCSIQSCDSTFDSSFTNIDELLSNMDK